MRAVFFLATFAATATLACAGDDDAPPERTSGIEGLVLAGPQCPVEEAGVLCPDQPLEAVIEIYSSDGSELITTTRSDADGRFYTPLDPGDYLLVPLPPDPGSPFPVAGEQQVIVRPNSTTEVAISYDTGIR
jgi:hypothetical protein